MRRILVLSLVSLAAACADDGSSNDDVGSATDSSSSSESSSASESASESSSSDSSSTDPTGTDSSSTDPTGTDSSSTDPTTTDSSSTDPTTTDSSSTDPTTTDSTTGGTCVPIEPLVAVEHPGFTGSGMCEGVHQNVALLDQAAVDAHAGDYCTSLGMCINPGPPCEQAPTLEPGAMIVYAFGEGSGCSFTMDIVSVEDCGDAIVVTGDFTQIGPCAVIGYAWAAVQVPSSDLPVEFVIQ